MKGRSVLYVLILALSLALLAGPLAADAQQPAKVPRIGVLLLGTSPATVSPAIEAFRQGLRDLGYVEGQNITLELRWGEGKLERLPDLAAELVRLKMGVIVAASTPAALAAAGATTTIPIVFVLVADPVAAGLVASLARPGGNLTGPSWFGGLATVGKFLQLLTESVPKLSRVAVLSDPAYPLHATYVRGMEVAARALGVKLQILEVREPNELESAFAAMARDRAGGLVVLPTLLIAVHAKRIIDLAAKHRLPAIYPFSSNVEDGGLMSYGTSVLDQYRRAAIYVHKILKGAKPADLPVEQPTKFELVINLKTAKALGLTIPPSLLLQADEVIHP